MINDGKQRMTITWCDTWATHSTVEASLESDVLRIDDIVTFFTQAMQLFGFTQESVGDELIAWAHEFEEDNADANS